MKFSKITEEKEMSKNEMNLKVTIDTTDVDELIENIKTLKISIEELKQTLIFQREVISTIENIVKEQLEVEYRTVVDTNG